MRYLISKWFKSIISRPCTIISMALLSSCATTNIPRAADRSAIETADARRLQQLAEDIAQSPEIIAVKKELQVMLEQNPIASTPAGQATLLFTLNEMSLAFITQAVTIDTEHPALLWWLLPPHQVKGKSIPGARYGLDNPDNVYQITSLDPTEEYVVHGKRQQYKPEQISFSIYPPFLINKTGKPDAEVVNLIEPVMNPDGNAYTITIGPSEPNGRPNHMKNKPDGHFMLVRQTLSDWQQQQPDILEITRLSPSQAAPLTKQRYIMQSVELLREAFPYWLDFMGKNVYSVPVNTLPQAFPRDGGWGLASTGHFNLKSGEGLLVSLDPLDAGYVSILGCNPWMLSFEYIHKTGSLNSAQTKLDAEGNYSYVISATDPGVHNWIDTGGLNAGTLFLRWQALSSNKVENLAPILSVKTVLLSELDQHLPKGTPYLSAKGRVVQQQTRAKEWRQRLNY